MWNFFYVICCSIVVWFYFTFILCSTLGTLMWFEYSPNCSQSFWRCFVNGLAQSEQYLISPPSSMDWFVHPMVRHCLCLAQFANIDWLFFSLYSFELKTLFGSSHCAIFAWLIYSRYSAKLKSLFGSFQYACIAVLISGLTALVPNSFWTDTSICVPHQPLAQVPSQILLDCNAFQENICIRFGGIYLLKSIIIIHIIFWPLHDVYWWLKNVLSPYSFDKV